MTKRQFQDKLEENILLTIKTHQPKTVDQLIELVRQRDNSLSRQEILDRVLGLQSQGKLSLEEIPTPTPQRITHFLRTPDANWYWATIACVVLTTIVTFTVSESAYPLVYARYVLGTIFVIWLPGYTFIKALFPTAVPIKTPTKNLDAVERIALSLGMSLALVPIVGLLLNYTPWGIRLTPIVLSLLSLTTVFATTAIIREHRNKLEKEP